MSTENGIVGKVGSVLPAVVYASMNEKMIGKGPYILKDFLDDFKYESGVISRGGGVLNGIPFYTKEAYAIDVELTQYKYIVVGIRLDMSYNDVYFYQIGSEDEGMNPREYPEFLPKEYIFSDVPNPVYSGIADIPLYKFEVGLMNELELKETLFRYVFEFDAKHDFFTWEALGAHEVILKGNDIKMVVSESLTSYYFTGGTAFLFGLRYQMPQSANFDLNNRVWFLKFVKTADNRTLELVNENSSSLGTLALIETHCNNYNNANFNQTTGLGSWIIPLSKIASLSGEPINYRKFLITIPEMNNRVDELEQEKEDILNRLTPITIWEGNIASGNININNKYKINDFDKFIFTLANNNRIEVMNSLENSTINFIANLSTTSTNDWILNAYLQKVSDTRFTIDKWRVGVHRFFSSGAFHEEAASSLKSLIKIEGIIGFRSDD